jgi:hypothetical protein
MPNEESLLEPSEQRMHKIAESAWVHLLSLA